MQNIFNYQQMTVTYVIVEWVICVYEQLSLCNYQITNIGICSYVCRYVNGFVLIVLMFDCECSCILCRYVYFPCVISKYQLFMYLYCTYNFHGAGGVIDLNCCTRMMIPGAGTAFILCDNKACVCVLLVFDKNFLKYYTDMVFTYYE